MNNEKSDDKHQGLSDLQHDEFDNAEVEEEWSRLIESNPDLLFELINKHPRH